jgi:uncharacterized protein
VAAGWALLDLKARGLAPVAMVFEVVNPVFVQGCVLAGIPIAAGLQPTPTRRLRSDQWARLDPAISQLITVNGQAVNHEEGSEDGTPS